MAYQSSHHPIMQHVQSKLDTARHCYELLNMQPEELIQTILAQGPVLSEEDYRYG